MPREGWDAYYKAHDESAVDLMIRLTALREKKRFRDIEAGLKAYLRYHGKNATANMYELLAVAIQINGGGKRGEEAKTAIGWAAFLAKRGRDAALMTNVADLMVINGLDAIDVKDAQGNAHRTRVGELLDLAAEKSPQSDRPLLMSLSLAQRQKDADRMIDAAEKVLALGWPGVDEMYRGEVRRMVEAQAKRLREEGRSSAADAILSRLAAAEARDVHVRLSWEGDAMLDISVEEPLGATASTFSPRTVFGGAVVQQGRKQFPESIYVCPRGFDGEYKVSVQVLYNNEKVPVRRATLEIVTHEGTPQEQKESRTVSLDKPEPVTFKLEGGRRKTVLPFIAPPRIQIKRGDAAKDKTAGPEAAPKAK